MFKRFHQTYQVPKKSKKEKEIVTYADLGKEKTKRATTPSQYSQRHQKAKEDNTDIALIESTL